jgi:hypothetical protein
MEQATSGQRSSLVIENSTSYDMSISASYDAPSDWGPGNKPAFRNLRLPRRTSTSQDLIIAQGATSALLTLTFVVDMGKQQAATITAKVNQCDALTAPGSLLDPDKRAEKDFLQVADDSYVSDMAEYRDVQCRPAGAFKLWQSVSAADGRHMNCFVVIAG